ncbi:uncharacterized protein LOC119331896 isoform X2 [Triticum dicoccoides]|uniref:uncharacterized protein LOC119331896 isoform X2 n=1 Tax=Triticum dicoccoides TaxID=85692 RepID=UPI0018914BCB|nr:uncharacterized protein LOC119331896 isoform X2 [Triticum dicoccoides]
MPWLNFVVRSRSRVLSGGSVALFNAFVFVVSYTIAYTLTHYDGPCSKFEAGRNHDIDGIHNNHGSFDIWIDRCSVVDYDDELIDIMRQSIDIACLQYFQFNNYT